MILFVSGGAQGLMLVSSPVTSMKQVWHVFINKQMYDE